MPDWSYRTLFRPLLFRLPAPAAREATLRTFGLLGKLPGGPFLIRTMGHMERSSVLESRVKETAISYPVGLGGSLDPHGWADTALSMIGFGFMEVGPVTLEPHGPILRVGRAPDREAVLCADPYRNDGAEAVHRRLAAYRGRLPLMLRLSHTPGCGTEEAFAQLYRLSERLSPHASALCLDITDGDWTGQETAAYCSRVIPVIRSTIGNKPLFLHLPLEYPAESLEALLRSIPPALIDGYATGEYYRNGEGWEAGRDGKARTLEMLNILRPYLADHHAVIVSAGVHEPQDALDLRMAGADYILLNSGLVYSGPGLPKRINEAVLHEVLRQTEPQPDPAFWRAWGWAVLLGLGMILGGVLAWIIAATSVLLPYDEAYLGLDAEQLAQSYPLVVKFMSHDRITLAGTMISIGVMYAMLGGYGLRARLHWARTALLSSGIVGFSSFFLYLGYGYLDPLHAAAGAALLPLFILSMQGSADRLLRGQPHPVNDRSWLLAQWGQLMFVILGAAFAVGGMVISWVGITGVFVPEDLEYLRTTAPELAQINGRLTSLIAHDRAGFGGALLSDAIAVLAVALWGIQAGERWIWSMLLMAGLPGFIAVFGVHGVIGYTDFIHLLPAYLAFAVYAAGLVLLYPYLMSDVRRKQQ